MVSVFEPVIIFVLSLLILIKASQVIIKKAIEISKILRISRFAVGFILVAISTSFPELMISMVASLGGNTGIAVGNVIGSNIANILLVLGITALLGTVKIRKKWIFDNASVLLAMSMIPLILVHLGQIGFITGVSLFIVFLFYCYGLVKSHVGYGEWREPKLPYVLRTYILFYAAVITIVIAARYLVDSGIVIAGFFGIPQSFIGLTLIALGTSLPELMVNVVAIKKREVNLALGNILGSCITNLTLVLGVAAMISPLKVDLTVFTSSTVFLIGASMFLWYILTTNSKISKGYGVLLILAYVIFLMFESQVIHI